jgi:hypothetical protein
MNSQAQQEPMEPSALGPPSVPDHHPGVAAKRQSGPSGVHTSPKRQLVQSVEDFEAQDKHAKRRKQTWSEWVREALADALARQSGK